MLALPGEIDSVSPGFAKGLGRGGRTQKKLKEAEIFGQRWYGVTFFWVNTVSRYINFNSTQTPSLIFDPVGNCSVLNKEI